MAAQHQRGAVMVARAVATEVSSTIKVTDQQAAPLFQPFTVGDMKLTNRLVLPPLTRMRATPGNVPTPIMAEYYGQRATAGSLFIAEGTYISPSANGYPCAPGLYSEEQVEAWKPIVQAVKAKGGFFVNQLWHCGRASHPALQPNGALPVAPSALAISDGTKVFLPDFTPADYPVPQALDETGIASVINDYRTAARNAVAAGFDGVEIHAANGYLIAQFINDSTNKRTDKYGGSIENRARFVLEVVQAVTEEVGQHRTGIRLAPFTRFLDSYDSTPYATYTYIVEQLAARFPKLAYVHMVEARAGGNVDNPEAVGTLEPFRKVWHGPFIAAGGFNAHSGAHAVASGHADLVAYGRQWIANPDLAQRFATGAPLNPYDRSTFYGGSDKGYTDYPTLEQAGAAKQ